jgi:adenylate cyclase
MFTDMVGSTAAAQANEAEALRLRDEQEEAVRPLFTAHQGREVKSIGDGFLVVFDSALRAVECAVDIQEHLHERNLRPNAPPILLRIGLHLGDVEERGSDVVGDAVNVASRIEPLAEPGGICITEPVFGLVRNKMPNHFEKLGPKTLKGVRDPVEVYRVRLARNAETRLPTGLDAKQLDNSRIAVLPFLNISSEPGDDYFADGMTEELIERLAHVSGLHVIARTTAMHYKNSRATTLEIGRELHVGTVVECSVRKAGNRIRITAQLIDTGTEAHLWASRYDRELTDVFAVQDEIAGQIATSLTAHLPALGAKRPLAYVHDSPDTPDMEAYTTYLQGRKLLLERGSEVTIRQAIVYFEDALRRDPKLARAKVGIAEANLWLSGEGAAPFRESVDRCRELLAQALAQNETLAEAHSVLAGLLVGDDELAAAEREARRAIELNPSLSDPYRWLAQIAAGDGRISDSIHLLEAAQQIDPVDVNVLAFLGRAYIYGGREADALAHWKRTLPLIPFRTNAHLAEYYLGLPDYARAELSVREMERLRPESLWAIVFRGMLVARRGDEATARHTLEELRRRGNAGELTVFFEGFVHFALGEMDAFVQCLEKAFELHALPLMELMYSRLYAPARSDPRIIDLIRRQHDLRPPSN